jgi:surface protein
MKQMFEQSSGSFPGQFKQDIGGWDVGNVTDYTDFDAGLQSGSWLPEYLPCFTCTAITSNAVFDTAVALWFSDEALCISTYGHIRHWNTSAVTNMAQTFKNKTTFNEDISGWDVSNVTTMWAMFQGASAFNNGGSQYIYQWDVSNVTHMNQMFQQAVAFNQPIYWDVGKVENMNHMFRGLWNAKTTFNQNISGWITCASHTDFDTDTDTGWTADEKPNWCAMTGQPATVEIQTIGNAPTVT